MTPARPTVWITRAEPGASATAAAVKRLGFEPLVAPLLEVRPLPAELPHVDAYDHLIFTSANAVRRFADLTDLRGKPVYAVGPATADAARGLGFSTVVSADGDLTTLSDLLVEQRLAGVALHPGAREPAGEVRVPGLLVLPLPIYETVALDPPDFAAPPDAILIHSPRAGQLLAQHPALWSCADILAISANAAAPFGDAARVASAPNEPALLALLGNSPGFR